MLSRALVGLVRISLKAPGTVLLVCLAGAILLGFYAATHFNSDADTNKLISPTRPWRSRR